MNTTAATTTVRVAVWSASGRLTHRERTFKTLAACNRWLDKLEESGNLHEVTGFLAD